MKIKRERTAKVLAPMFIALLGALASSCQKSGPDASGFFSKAASRSQDRFPAEVLSFSQYQDPKQIYIYCSTGENDAATAKEQKECYERWITRSLKNYAEEKEVSPLDIQKIKDKYTFDRAELASQEILEELLQQARPSMSALVQSRANFCSEHASFSRLERCLGQFLKKETFEALNELQNSQEKLNGREYLFVKKGIERELNRQLAGERQQIESEMKDKDSARFKRELELLRPTLERHRHWIYESSTIVEAKNNCVASALKSSRAPVSLSLREAADMASDIVCLPLLSSPEIKKDIDAQTYAVFEQKLKDYQRALLERGEWQKRCGGEKDMRLSACLSNAWTSESEKVFDRWAKENSNGAFKNQKSLFIMRAGNNAEKIKKQIARGIAAE